MRLEGKEEKLVAGAMPTALAPPSFWVSEGDGPISRTNVSSAEQDGFLGL